MNPYDARSCNHCGTADLLEGTASIPLGWVSRLLIILATFYTGRWLLLTVSGAQNLSFKSLTGYTDARVWIIEKFANFLIVLLVFSLLSSFIPGEAGKMFRSVMFGIVGKAIALCFKMLERVLVLSGKLIIRALDIELDSSKKKKH